MHERKGYTEEGYTWNNSSYRDKVENFHSNVFIIS